MTNKGFFELEFLIHRHLAVREFWDRILDATQQSCSGVYDWVENQGTKHGGLASNPYNDNEQERS